jgi:hypothetical protein
MPSIKMLWERKSQPKLEVVLHQRKLIDLEIYKMSESKTEIDLEKKMIIVP